MSRPLSSRWFWLLSKFVKKSATRQILQSTARFLPGRLVRLRGAALQGLQGLQGLVHLVSTKMVTLLVEILGRQKLGGVEHHQIELV